MPPLKKNHTIPKCLIKEWAIEGPRYQGVHVFEKTKDKPYFSASNGGSGFSFAIRPDIYIAQNDAKRIVSVEKWLGSTENTLSIFLRGIKTSLGKSLLRTEQDFFKLLLALFSLKHRSPHNLKAIKEFLIKNPEYKEDIGSAGEENMNIVVLENFINQTTEETLRYAHCELIICKNKQADLILGDRPFVFDDVEGYSFFPLTPEYLLSIRKVTEKPYYHYSDDLLSDKMVHEFNSMIAHNSREWIIARNEELLHKYIPLLIEGKDETIPYYEPVQQLKHGYKIG